MPAELHRNCKVFGSSLFVHGGVLGCCMRWLAAVLAAGLMCLVHDLTEHCSYSYSSLVLTLVLALTYSTDDEC